MKKQKVILFSLVLLAMTSCALPFQEEPIEEQVQYIPPGEITITVRNVHEEYSLSAPVIVIHAEDISFSFVDELAPEYLEPLAELGEQNAFLEHIKSLEGVEFFHAMEQPLAPGERKFISLEAPKNPSLRLSVLAMVTQSNDGFALVDGAEITKDSGEILTTPHVAKHYDAGTEENTALGTGFFGGQPDPTKGAENKDNGVASSRPVSIHSQLKREKTMRVTVSS